MKENEILSVIRSRRSVTRFSDTPVESELLDAVLEAGRWAPSFVNSQPWEFVVVRDPAHRARAAEILRRVTVSWQGFSQAPVLIVVAVDPHKDPRHHVEDGAAAAQNMALMAHSLGLATFWAGLYGGAGGRGSPEEELRSLLSLPRGFRIIAVLPVGFPAHEVKTNPREYRGATTRRPLDEMVHTDRFSA